MSRVGDARALDGEVLDLDGAPTTIVYDGTKIDYVEVVQGSATYRQTYTYTGDNLTGLSGWVKQ